MAYTENEEPTGLTALTSLDSADVFVVGDVSDASEVAKKITKANLITDLGITVGPSSATDNALARFNGTTGKLIQSYTSNPIRGSDLGQLSVGADTVFVDTDNTPVQISANLNDYSQVYHQNKSNGDSAFTDFICAADNDDAGTAGHFIDMGITSSGFVGTAAAAGVVKSVSVTAGGTGYTVGNVLTLATGDTNCTVTVLTAPAGVVATVALTENGTSYTAGTKATTGGSGSGCTINVLTFFDYTISGVNDGYLYVSGGNLAIGVDDTVAGKSVRFFTGGQAAANERARISDTGLELGLTGTLTGALRLKGATSGTAILTVPTAAGTPTITLPTTTGTLATLGNAETLTTKTLTSPVIDIGVTGTAVAVAAGINTGTSTTTIVTPDALAGSNLGTRYVAVTLNGTTALTTSEKAYFRIPAAFTGMDLVGVTATVGTGAAGSSSSGTPTFTVRNVTDSQQMLSTSLTVDATEYTSATAAVPVVINTSFDDVVTGDLIEVACTVAGTGVTYTTITMAFRLP